MRDIDFVSQSSSVPSRCYSLISCGENRIQSLESEVLDCMCYIAFVETDRKDDNDQRLYDFLLKIYIYTNQNFWSLYVFVVYLLLKIIFIFVFNMFFIFWDNFSTVSKKCFETSGSFSIPR